MELLCGGQKWFGVSRMYVSSKVSQRSSLKLASFGFFGHKGWIQPSALTAGFHSSVTIRNFKKLQCKRFKAIINLKQVVLSKNQLSL